MITIVQTAAGIIRRNASLSRVVLACVPDIHWHVNIQNIGPLRIRIRRNRSFWLRPLLQNEWYPLAALRVFVGPTDVVWDVGANIGLYTRWLVTHLNAKYVCAFEPMSDNLPELRHNLEIGKITDRTMVLPWAIADVEGEVEFQIDDMQSASGAVNAVTGGEASPGRFVLGLPPKIEKVTCRTVDGIMLDGSIPMPNVIKIDVEGAERLLLDGGEKFFTDHSPRMLIETHSLGVSKQCLEFLFDHGYAVAGCVPQSWNADRHLRLDRSVLLRMTGRYDVHFIMATKDPAQLPDKLDYERL